MTSLKFRSSQSISSITNWIYIINCNVELLLIQAVALPALAYLAEGQLLLVKFPVVDKDAY